MCPLCPLAVLMLVATAVGADYYVSPAGSDANAGTSAGSPWRTVAKVNGRALVAGDRVFFQGGQTFSDAPLVLDAGDVGTAVNPIVIGSYGSGRATLQPPGDANAVSIYNTGGIRVENVIAIGPGPTVSSKTGLQAYCDLPGGVKLPAVRFVGCQASGFRAGIQIGAWHSSYSGFRDGLIEGCVVRDCLRDGITTYGYTPASQAQRSHANLVIRGCEVSAVPGDPLYTASNTGSGIIMSGTIGGLIDRCYAHHNGGSGAGGGPVGIWCYDATGVVIQRSLVHDQKTKAGQLDGGGFDIDGGCNGCVIQYCYSYGNEGSGYLVCEYNGGTPLTDSTIRYCISWNDGRRRSNAHYGIHFYNGNGTGASLSGVRVHNNLVFVDNAVGVGAIRHHAGPIADVLVANNIFVVANGARLVDVGSGTGAFAFRNNAYFAVDGNYASGWRWGGTVLTSLAAFRGAAGAPETLSGAPLGFQVDPRVAALIAPIQPTSVAQMEAMTAFRLLSGSPMIDAGVDLRTAAYGSVAVGERDCFANAIPQGPAFDVGPHEAAPSVANRAPAITTARPATLTTREDGAATLPLAANDADGDPLTWSIATPAAKGTATVSASGLVTYVPNVDAIGSDGCVVQVTDGRGGADTIALAVVVTAVNDAPSFVRGVDRTVAEDAGAQVATGWATAISPGPADEAGQAVTFQVTGTTNAALFGVAPAVAANGTLTFTPAANATGSATITLVLRDAGGTADGGADTSAAQTFTITITPVNDVPMAAATISGQTAAAGSAYTFVLPAGTFSDPDGDPLTWSASGLPAGLTFAAATRTISGTPTTSGARTVTLTARDPAGASASATFVLTVGLPVGWLAADVGGVSAGGSTSWSVGAWSLAGSGADIWNTADEFRFAWTTVTGDVSITATVSSLTAVDAWTKAGVMIRESGAAGSRHAFTCVTRDNGTAFQRRVATGASSAHTAGPRPAAPAPYRVRLERIGDVFIGSVSADGATWREIRRETIPMATTTRVGLAVTSHRDGQLATAGFSGVEIISASSATN